MNNSLTNSERFVNTYNRLDRHMRKQLQKDDYIGHTSLIELISNEGNSDIRRYSNKLKQFAKLRNAIVHNPKDQNSYSIAEPHDIVVDEYENFYNKIINPPLAINNLATPSGKIYTTSLDSNALEVIDAIKENSYTHVPVLKDRDCFYN